MEPIVLSVIGQSTGDKRRDASGDCLTIPSPVLNKSLFSHIMSASSTRDTRLTDGESLSEILSWGAFQLRRLAREASADQSSVISGGESASSSGRSTITPGKYFSQKVTSGKNDSPADRFAAMYQASKFCAAAFEDFITHTVGSEEAIQQYLEKTEPHEALLCEYSTIKPQSEAVLELAIRLASQGKAPASCTSVQDWLSRPPTFAYDRVSLASRLHDKRTLFLKTRRDWIKESVKAQVEDYQQIQQALRTHGTEKGARVDALQPGDRLSMTEQGSQQEVEDRRTGFTEAESRINREFRRTLAVSETERADRETILGFLAQLGQEGLEGSNVKLPYDWSPEIGQMINGNTQVIESMDVIPRGADEEWLKDQHTKISESYDLLREAKADVSEGASAAEVMQAEGDKRKRVVSQWCLLSAVDRELARYHADNDENASDDASTIKAETSD
jgi:hypothetical protein